MLPVSCKCGEVRYEVDAEPFDVYVCHCTERRNQSSSVFGISAIVLSDARRLVRGKPKIWSRHTANRGEIVCSFCETCGSRLSHPDPTEVTLSVKCGSLASPIALTNAYHIWTQTKLSGVEVPEGAKTSLKEPT